MSLRLLWGKVYRVQLFPLRKRFIYIIAFYIAKATPGNCYKTCSLRHEDSTWRLYDTIISRSKLNRCRSITIRWLLIFGDIYRRKVIYFNYCICFSSKNWSQGKWSTNSRVAYIAGHHEGNQWSMELWVDWGGL